MRCVVRALTERADRIEPICILHAVQLDARLMPRPPPALRRAQAPLVRPAHILDDPHDGVRAPVRAQVERRRLGGAPEEGLEERACVVAVRRGRDVLLVEHVVQ